MTAPVYGNPRINRVKRRRKIYSTIALGYTPGVDEAPQVLAAGQGALGEKILELAMKHNIPVRQDAILAAALSTVNVGEMIPPELYRVVAEVLAYVYRIQENEGKGRIIDPESSGE